MSRSIPSLLPRKYQLRTSGRPLELTYSTAEVMAYLGLKATKLHELLNLGAKHQGCHPLKGGLYPTFRVSHKNRRIPLGAIERHLAHMTRIETDDIFAAQMRVQARMLGESSAA